MCIAIVKKAGIKMPTEETLNICFENNPHGCGYCINRNGENLVFKGFMKLQDMLNDFKETKPLQSETVLIHFRVASVGSIKKENCHPFVVTSNYQYMLKTKIKTSLPVLIHNGTFKRFNDKKNDYSDTMQFTKMMSEIFQSNFINYKSFNNFINAYVEDNNSRVAIVYKNGKTNMYGNWIKDNESKLFFSNESFKKISNRFAVQQLEFDFNI